MSNRNNRKDSNKGPLGKEQSSKGTKTQSGGDTSRQNQEEKKSQAPNNDGWDNMWSKPTQSKLPEKDANQQQQNKKGDKKNTQSDLQMVKAQSQIYADMDDAIVSVDESQSSSDIRLRKNQSEIQKNSFQRKEQNKDLIFAGFGGSGTQKGRGGNPKRSERELTKTSWVGKSGKEEVLGDLENTTPFDQFANRNTTYNESLYNTSFNVKSFSKQQVQYAAKIEREINNADSNGNVHVAEERNQIQLRDNDNEEIKYSGVRRAPQLKNAKKFSGFKKNTKQKLLNNFRQAYNKTNIVSEEVILNPYKWDELRDKYQTISPASEPEWNNSFTKQGAQPNQNQFYQRQSQQNQYQNKQFQQNNSYQNQNNQDYSGVNSYQQNNNYKGRYPNQNYNQSQQQNFNVNQGQQTYHGNQQSLNNVNANKNYYQQPSYQQNQVPTTYINLASASPYNPQANIAPQVAATTHHKPLSEQRSAPQFEPSFVPTKTGVVSQTSMNASTVSFTPSFAQNSQPWKPQQSAPPAAQELSMSTNAPSFKMNSGSASFKPNY